jgi:hypothetical protein
MSDGECPVCMCTMNEKLVRLPCDHRMCSVCLFKLNRLVCPLCRSRLFVHATRNRRLFIIQETSGSDSEDDMLVEWDDDHSDGP